MPASTLFPVEPALPSLKLPILSRQCPAGFLVLPGRALTASCSAAARPAHTIWFGFSCQLSAPCLLAVPPNKFILLFIQRWAKCSVVGMQRGPSDTTPALGGIFSLANSSARGERVAVVRQHGWGWGVVGVVGVRGISGRGDRRGESLRAFTNPENCRKESC